MDLKTKIKFWLRQFPFVFPLKIIGSCQDWIDRQRKTRGVHFSQRGPWYKTVSPEEFLHHAKPQTLGHPNKKAFYNNIDYPTGKSTLFYLQNVYLLGHKGLILTSGHELFQE